MKTNAASHTTRANRPRRRTLLTNPVFTSARVLGLLLLAILL